MINLPFTANFPTSVISGKSLLCRVRSISGQNATRSPGISVNTVSRLNKIALISTTAKSFGLFIFAILAGIIWNLWAILICIFMIVKDVEHLTVSQPFEISLKIPVCLDLYPKFNLNLTFFLKCTYSNNSCMYTSSWFINPHYMYIPKYMYLYLIYIIYIHNYYKSIQSYCT